MTVQQRRYFVTGTDTDVGKSVVSAWLVQQLQADYWKPIQSGLLGPTDAQIVQKLANLDDDRIHPSTYTLTQPLSPHESARRDDVTIRLHAFSLPQTPRSLIVEGAGGLLVPLNDHCFIIDLVRHLQLPVILVARTTLGTINHTLLSLEALGNRHLHVTGIILNGPENPANLHAIRSYGNTPILAHLPPLDPLNSSALAQIAPLCPF
ncbi:MAG: dethiobiotin synthase [Magnetococcales bacterium]|nr:dethiobiotin synthase [Magnetococcales bacterium]